MKKAVTAPTRLIDITPLPLKDIVIDKNWLRVGALVPNSDLAADARVQEKFPLLSQALLAGASPQLRNMATVGGNLLQRTRCSYFYDNTMPCNKRKSGSGCGALEGINRMHAVFGASNTCVAVHPSDMCVALAAMDARIEVRGPKGTRQIAISDFHRLPGNDASRDNTLQPFGNPLNRHHFFLVVHHRERQAGVQTTAIHMDGTGAALSMVAALFGTGQLELFTQQIEQRYPRLNLQVVPTTVYFQSKRQFFEHRRDGLFLLSCAGKQRTTGRQGSQCRRFFYKIATTFSGTTRPGRTFCCHGIQFCLYRFQYSLLALRYGILPQENQDSLASSASAETEFWPSGK